MLFLIDFQDLVVVVMIGCRMSRIVELLVVVLNDNVLPPSNFHAFLYTPSNPNGIILAIAPRRSNNSLIVLTHAHVSSLVHKFGV